MRLIAESIGGLTFLLDEGAAEHATHPLLDLIPRLNLRQESARFPRKRDVAFVAGRQCVHRSGRVSRARARQIRHAQQAQQACVNSTCCGPDRMKVVPGADGWPQGFEYSVGGTGRAPVEQDAAQPPILHLTLFNPLDDYYGLSPLEAAAIAVDTHNAAANWNKALLDNPRGHPARWSMAGPKARCCWDVQFEHLKKELGEQYQGTANAGRPLLLEGGLDWKPMSLSPKDMDFMEAKHSAAREIALAFGVPPMLMAIPGDNTYSNYQEANRVFWRAPRCRSKPRRRGADAMAGAELRGRARAGRRYRQDRGAVARPRRTVGARHQGAVPHRQRKARRHRLRRGVVRGCVQRLVSSCTKSSVRPREIADPGGTLLTAIIGPEFPLARE